MKQIIVITDGNSNEGLSPVTAAAQAYARGVIVNVIGIVGQDQAGMAAGDEIEGIARAGGGIHRMIVPSKLASTMQMVTRHTVVATIQQVVNEELRTIFKDETASLASLSPAKRAQVVQSMDQWTETSPLQVVLLVDASASMKPQFDTVREAAVDFMLSLQARSGKSELAVLHFPGDRSQPAEVDTGWTTELAKVEKILYKLNVKGTTPTGPAILRALELFEDRAAKEDDREDPESVWGDYVV